MNRIVSVLATASEASGELENPPYDPKKLSLRIVYCGGWGYERFFLSLKEALEVRFPGRIDFYPVKDIQPTGNFEITLLNTSPPKLIHSKQTMPNLGKCSSEAERKRLYKILAIYDDYLRKQVS